ncbi:coiled-coil domain-containing protein 15 [Tachyglossus aculeatus]|uniref:coiled-coil domain-containing protein 15 n=1 Tax=Tachyglossus aculeatus TaxID=9261 RepID=UPI0018F5E17B|nr:coiled-coil domain-containing protein 15 [Tachyglossus aculeatus]
MPVKMVPPTRQHSIPRLLRARTLEEKSRTLLAVLAERNQAVAPVGAWVESAPRGGNPEETPAFVSAFLIEKKLKEQEKTKQETLKRFQGQVKRRVNQRIKLRLKQQLQKACEAAEKEGSMALQTLASAPLLAHKRSTCVYRSRGQAAVCGSLASGPPPQPPIDELEDDQAGATLFQQQARALSQTMRQVRRRLAACKTTGGREQSSPPELPGGRWERSPTREEPSPTSQQPSGPADEEPEDQLPLQDYRDLPAEFQDQTSPGEQTHPEPRRASSPSRPHSGARTNLQLPLVLQPGKEQEEAKNERQKQFLQCRRLFMGLEREQVKERQRLKEHQRKSEKIKKQKEQWRQMEEQRILATLCQDDQHAGEEACETMAQLRLEETRGTKKQQKDREYRRYVEALRAQMQEKIRLYNVALPPMCCCGSDFWDAHPDTCANNCIFYRNHRAYSQALRSVISSCDVSDLGPAACLAGRGFAAAYGRSAKKP